MSAHWVTVEVPFINVGNRLALTDQQIFDCDSIREFFDRFKHCFERSDHADIWLLIEPEKPH